MPVAGLISKDASHVALRLPVWRARRSSGSSSAARVREGGLAGLLVGFLLGGESWGRDFGSHVWVEVFVEDFGWERMQLRFHLPSLGPSFNSSVPWFALPLKWTYPERYEDYVK